MSESPIEDYKGKDDRARLGELMSIAGEAPALPLPGDASARGAGAKRPTVPESQEIPPAQVERRSWPAGETSGASASVGAGEAPFGKVAGYRLVREIARGGQAVVYESVQTSTGRKVALKVLIGGAFVVPSIRARFDREVQILASLRHPNIVQIIDRGHTADGSLFLVMDLISGKPLDTYLENYYRCHPDGPPPEDPSELLRLFLKIAEAVNAAHVRGVIHRDLKPSNIRVDERGEPYVLDFGLARPSLPSNSGGDEGLPVTMIGHFLGSLPWASPEQAEGDTDELDVRTDVYSLGVILYQMLTGRFPYAVAGTMRDILNNIVTAQPTPPSVVNVARRKPVNKKGSVPKRVGSVHPAVEAIVLKALAKSRNDRYQSAGDFARDVRNYLSGRATDTVFEEPQGKRFPAAMMALAIVLIGATTVACWLTFGKKGGSSTPSDGIANQLVSIRLNPSPAVKPSAPTGTDFQTLHASASPFPDPTNRQQIVNSLGMKLFRIDAGSFVMGTSMPQDTSKFAPTVHHVTLTKSFWMGGTEVTVAQWKSFVADTNYVTARERNPGEPNWKVPGWPNSDDLPVNNISWEGAVEFCNWLGKKETKPYRLPTEAEWEYACGAGTTGDFNTADRPTPDDAQYNFAYEGGTKPDRPRPPTSLRPNAWGLRGMHGNVAEWCSDWVAPYPGQSAVDPTGPDHQWGDPARGEGKVSRGGQWDTIPPLCTSWSRSWSAPAYGGGFRVVMDDSPLSTKTPN